jgi:acyl carrier protein
MKSTSSSAIMESNSPDLEEVVTGIWRRVLAQPNAGRDEGFFAGGGDSLRAMRLLAAVQNELQVEVPVDLFGPDVTISKLTQSIRELLSQANGSSADAREFGEV